MLTASSSGSSACHGSGDIQGQSRIYRHSMFIGLCVSAVVVAVVVTFAGTLVAVFNSQHSAQLADYAIPGLRLYFLGFLFAGANIVKSGFYSATGRGRESSILALCRGVVAIVAFAFLLSHLLGITGVWLAFPAAELFTLLLGLVLGRPQGLGAPDPRPA